MPAAESDTVLIGESYQVVGMDRAQLKAHNSRSIRNWNHKRIFGSFAVALPPPFQRNDPTLRSCGDRWTPGTRRFGRPTAPAMCGVPASNRCGASFHFASCQSTLTIISPPVWYGSMESSNSWRPYKTPMPVGPQHLWLEKTKNRTRYLLPPKQRDRRFGPHRLRSQRRISLPFGRLV